MTLWIKFTPGSVYERLNPRCWMPKNLDRQPCPIIMGNGIYGVGHGQYRLEDDGMVTQVESGKPPYHIAGMAEIAALPWNGLTVATTFAGCGGSSLGYRMAGYRVLYANEFVPAAQECYRLNMAEGTLIDPRDVRQVTARDILEFCGLREGELDLLDGSPPCQAFSTAGRRHRNWGTERKYEHGASQKNEDLFVEFARLVRGIQPRTFVAENVSGLVKGVAKGYFLDILRELKGCGYRVGARVLDAQWLGVPQCRQRVFFVGVREDLGLDPAFPEPLPYRYSVREALPWLGGARMAAANDAFEPLFGTTEQPSPTITAQGARTSGLVEAEKRYGEFVDVTDRPALTVKPGRRGGGTDDFRVVAEPRYGQRLDVTDRPAPAVCADTDHGSKTLRVIHDTKGQPQYSMGDVTDRPCPAITVGVHSVNAQHFQVVTSRGSRRRRESGKPHRTDEPLPAVIADGGRPGDAQYMVEISGRIGTHFKRQKIDPDRPMHAVVADEGQSRITVDDGRHRDMRRSPDEPAPTICYGRGNGAGIKGDGPSIAGFAIEAAAKKLKPGQGSTRYQNLVRSDAAAPCPTVTATTGIHPGAAGVIAPDGRRKFTIAELRRICAYPDDFALSGTYAQQWERLGNSVPPLMARAVAAAVRDGVLLPARAAAGRNSTATRRESGRSRAASSRKSKGAGASRARGSRRRG